MAALITEFLRPERCAPITAGRRAPPGLAPLLQARGFGPASVQALHAADGVTTWTISSLLAGKAVWHRRSGQRRADDLLAQLPSLRNPSRSLRLKPAWESAAAAPRPAARRGYRSRRRGPTHVRDRGRRPGPAGRWGAIGAEAARAAGTPSPVVNVVDASDRARECPPGGRRDSPTVAGGPRELRIARWPGRHGSEAHLGRGLAMSRGLGSRRGLAHRQWATRPATEQACLRRARAAVYRPRAARGRRRDRSRAGRRPAPPGHPRRPHGDLHCHTLWTDGSATLDDMARAARDHGYQYLALTDHSRSLTITNGLSLERLEEARRLVAPAEPRAGAVRRAARDRDGHPRRTARWTTPTTSWPRSTTSRPRCTAASNRPKSR